MKKIFFLLLTACSLNTWADGLTVINEGQEAVCISRIEHLAVTDYGGENGTFTPNTFITIPSEKTLTFTGSFSIDNKFGFSQSGQGTCFLALNEAKEQYIYSTQVEMSNYVDVLIALILAPFIGVAVFFGFKKYDELHPKPEKKKIRGRSAHPVPPPNP